MVSQTPLNDSTTIKQQISFAVRLCELQEYSQAESYLRTLLSQQPRNPHAWYLLSFIAARQKDYERAIQLIQKAITISPQKASFYHNLGNLYTNKKVFDKAVKCYRKAIALQPEVDVFYRSLGLVYVMSGKLVNANFHYGMANEKQGDFSEAIKFYQKVITARPDWVVTYERLASIYHQQGKLEDAIEYYQKVIELDSERIDSYYELGKIYQQKNLFPQAIDYYERAIQLQPDRGESYFNLSLIYHQQGNLAKAFQACQNALKYQSKSVNSFYPLDSTLPNLERSLEETELISLISNSITKEKKKSEKKNYFKDDSGLKTTNNNQELTLKTLQAILARSYGNRENKLTFPLQNSLPQNTSLVKQKKKNTAIIPVIWDKVTVDSEVESELEEVIEDDNDYEYDSIYHQHSIFIPLRKKVIARQLLDNKSRFLLISFVNPEQQQNLTSQLDFLAKTELSYILYQTPQAETSFLPPEKDNYLCHSKPNYLASVYEEIQGKKIKFARQLPFTHLVYLDFSCLLNLDRQTLDLLQQECDRCIDFSVYNWLQKISPSAIEQLNLEPKFLISCGSIQLYSLSQQSLWIWEVWQQAIVEYTARLTHETTQIFPGDESFLDYSWNSILRHIPKIKSAWLTQNNFNSQWTPLARTLVN